MTDMFIRNVSRRFGRVWQRNFDVYKATWKLNFIPPLLEPLLYLFAFGIGLGGMVKEVALSSGGSVPYTVFIAPGLVATAVMNHGFFETTYSSFVRMYFQRTFDAILATPLVIEDIVVGELVWGATKAFMAGFIMLVVVTAFGLMPFGRAVWFLPVCAIGGFAFSALGLCFTAWVKNIEMFNLPVFLFITPMFLFGGIFFPIETLPGWARAVASALPLTHLVTSLRSISTGVFDAGLARDIILLSGLALVAGACSIVFMKKRLMR